MSNTKTDFYLEFIDRSHETFREFLSHLPEDILEWKVHEYLPTVRELIFNILRNQLWIANYLKDKTDKKHTFPEENSGLTMEELVIFYDDFVKEITKKLRIVKNLELTDERDYKEYPMNVESWLYEYSHHLSKHSGEIHVAHIAWKRKERSLTS